VHELAHAKLGKWSSEEEADSLAKEWLKGKIDVSKLDLVHHDSRTGKTIQLS
jgi:hypothetical protein